MARIQGVEVHLGEITIRWKRDGQIDQRGSVSVTTYTGTCPEFPGVYVEIDALIEDEWDPGDQEWFIFGRISQVFYLPNAIIVHFEHPYGRGQVSVDDIELVQ